MKQFLVTVAACFTAGILLVALVFFLSFLPDLIEDASGEADPSGRTENPKGFLFLEQEVVAGTDTFTVRGVLENASGLAWNYPFITLRLTDSGNVVNSCEGMVSGTMQAASRRAFIVECKDTQSPASDKSYDYQLMVSSAMRHKG
jgi:hypothetical protein